MKKTSIAVFILFLALNLIPHFYIALNPSANLLNWYLTDDAFYYFKVAQNITEGQGITFDGIAPTNGFHPLWMLVCVPIFALARFDLYLPLRVLIVVQALLNALSGYFLFRLFSEHLNKVIGWVIAFFWMFLPAIHGITTKLGLETGLNVFALIFLLYQTARFTAHRGKGQFQSRELIAVSLAAVLALFSRLDNIFIILMLGLWLVFHESNMRWIAQLDFLLLLITALASYYLRIQTTDNIFNFLPFAYMLAGFSLVIKPLCLFFFGVYDFHGKVTAGRFLLKTIAAMSLASLLIAALFFILHDILHTFRGISRAVLVFDWVLSTGIITLFRWLLFTKMHDRYGTASTHLKNNWRDWTRRAILFFAPVFILLTAYMAANKWYAGSAMPVSGQIKRWWGLLPHTVYGRPIRTLAGLLEGLFETSVERGPFWMLTRPLNGIARWLSSWLGLPTFSPAFSFTLVLVWIVFLGLILALLVKSRRAFQKTSEKIALLPLFTGCVFHALSYKATGFLHAKYWYWLGEMLLITLVVGVLLSVFLNEISQQKSGEWKSYILPGFLCPALFSLFVLTLLRAFPIKGNVPSLYDYEADFRFLEKYTQKGDVIGMTGGGATAYFMPDRTFINLDGLINSSAYFDNLKKGTADQYLVSAGMQYVYGEELVLLDSDPYRWIFTDRLKVIDNGTMFTLYEFCMQPCP